MKQFTLDIIFGSSRSKNFNEAVELVEALGGVSRQDAGVHQLTRTLEPGAELAKVKKLFGLVSAWKSTELKLNNRTAKADRVAEIIAAVNCLRKSNVPSDWQSSQDWKAWDKPLGLDREKYRDQDALRKVVGPDYVPGEFHPIEFTLSYERLPNSDKNELVVRAESQVVGTIPTRYISQAVSSIKLLGLPPFRVPGVIRSNSSGLFNFFIWRKKLLDPGVSLWCNYAEHEDAVVAPNTRERAAGDIVVTVTLKPFGKLSLADSNVPPDWIESRAWEQWEAPVDIVAGAMFYLDDLEKLLGSPRLGGYFVPTPVQFLREPTNEHDANAITIRVHGTRLGYVSRHKAERIAPFLDRHGISSFLLAGVLRGDPPVVGCEIWIERRITRAPDLSKAIHIEEHEKADWPPRPGEAGHFRLSRQVGAETKSTEDDTSSKGCLTGFFRLLGLMS